MKPDFPYNKHPEFHCPSCGTVMDSTTSSEFEAVMPSDGDFSLCVQCLDVNVFAVSLLGISLRPATPEEQVEFEVDHGRYRDRLRRVKDQADASES